MTDLLLKQYHWRSKADLFWDEPSALYIWAATSHIHKTCNALFSYENKS